MRIKNCRGFTLIELMVTLAVAAILLVVAVPSYRGVVQRNSVVANVNDLVGDLNYARSQSVTRGQQVFVCSSHDQKNCSNDDDWAAGWIIFCGVIDPKTAGPNSKGRIVLRVQGASGNGFALSSDNPNPLGFDANGFADTPRTFSATGDNSARVTTITIAATGRVETDSATP